MQAKFLSTIILLAASLVSAAPAADPVLAEVYFCSEMNWDGNCTDAWINPSQCYSIGDLVSGGVFGSIGPSSKTTCTAHTAEDCKGDDIPLKFPGAADGGAAIGVPFTELRSMSCVVE
ncbi:hypothetical protein BDN72DRAFT_840460 [Pluteus cervinus]|uniref:Uncharacterized protein n=1 Tax=Pluteus cervinus TaxID=181527 RepID=A0ACD3AU68_9AGAR|nr:hypothetical protein BDN72DRAFT_840460 [Pluteus cervinus]